MAKLTFSEFLALYKVNPDQAFQKLEADELKIEDLFTSLNQLLHLYAAIRKKEFDALRLGNLTGQTRDIEKILEKSAKPIARLYTNSAEFAAAAEACPTFIAELFAKVPEIITPLFTQYYQTVELYKINAVLARDVLLKKTSLVATSHQFLDLNQRNTAIAAALFNEDSKRIADLLDENDLQKVAQCGPDLATKISDFKKSMPKPLPATVELKVKPLPNLETTDESTATKKESLSKSTQKISNSFLCQYLAALAGASGLVAIIVGILMAQPITIIAGLAISAVGALTLYGLFSQETAKDSPNKFQPDSTAPEVFKSCK